MRTLSIDIETYSSVDLGSCGVHKYVESEDFEVLLFAYSIDYGPVQVVDFANGECLPEDVWDLLISRDCEKTAYNAAFERTCLAKWCGVPMPADQWDCTMVLAASCGLPLGLKAVGEALGLSEEQAKMKEGAELIRMFCAPRKPTKNKPWSRVTPYMEPERWELFKEYNKRDVEVENTIRQKLLKWRPFVSEHKLWVLDQKINDTGMRADIQLAQNAIRIGNDYREQLLAEAKQVSGLDNPNSAEQVKSWLYEQEGMTVSSLNKKVIADVVAGLSSDDSKKFMDLRTEFSKSSVKKYEAILRSACSDEHIRGCFQFAGAGRTGRWAGRLVQLQNLPQNHLEDLDAARSLVYDGDEETFECLYAPNVQQTLSELIRTALIPEQGDRFIVADFAAIEARVIAWIAGEDWRMDSFAKGEDIYCASASQAFKVPVVKHGINGHLRQKGKILELACGYGGGVSAMKAFGADKLGMTDEEMAELVDKWRAASPHITALWKSLETSAIRCIRKGASTISTVGHIRFDMEDGVLWMTLPSGRRIAYWGASYGTNKWGNSSITYMGTDQKTKKWTRLETWGGKLTENLVQATARDCLKVAMLRLNEHGYDIRAHVHDEVIINAKDEDTEADVAAIMGQPIDWAPGLLLRADGYECEYYRKD